MSYNATIICVVVLSSITTAVAAYSHQVRNNSTIPIRATYLFGGSLKHRKSPVEIDLAPGEEKSTKGSIFSGLAAINLEYRGSDPRLSGLKTGWVPVGSPPVSTVTQIYTDPWPYDPDATTDPVGDPIIQPVDPKRHTAIRVAVQEFQ